MRVAVLTRSRSLSPNDTQSLRDKAYETIKHRIITLALKPGEYVNEASLSSQLGIGRTPVHQALDRLMVDGMVEVIPRKGVIVKPVSLDDVMQIIEVRLLNETYCAHLAAERADEREIEGLARVLESTHRVARARNIERMMLLDREFHLLLARAARNDVLADLLGKLHDRSLRFWFISLTERAHHENVQHQHGAILDAIRTHDPNAAEAAMRDHIESFRANVAKYI